jgi:hypothetical protein
MTSSSRTAFGSVDEATTALGNYEVANECEAIDDCRGKALS